MRGGVLGLVGVAGLIATSDVTAQTVTPLASVDDLRAVCSAQDARRYFTVALGARGFAFEPYDERRARLGVDVSHGLRPTDGAELVLHDIAGQAPPIQSDLDVAVPVDRVEAASLIAAHQRGELVLRLTFQLATPVDGAPVCATTLRADGEGMRAAIELAAFEIVRGGVRVASGESARWGAGHDSTASKAVIAPRVVISPPRLTQTGGRAPATVARAAAALSPRLLECYRLGLGEEPNLRGPFVAGLEIGRDGRVRTARAELDGLGAPGVTSCVLKLVRAARFPGNADRLSIAMRFSD